ncbi:MAG: hypothetical protein RL087_1482 [Pseudomonadota bacterium]|jgi:spheroidene monooxygenase
MSTPDPVAAALSGVVVVILVDYLRQHQAWGWMRLVQGPGVLRDEPGLQFAKVMGSGHEGGFSLRPSTTHQGLICMFANAAQADAFLTGPHVQQMRERARESWTGILSVTASRGSWDGQVWGTTPASVLGAYASAGQAESGAIAALTRASIRPAKTATFWRMAPAAQSELDHAPGCEIAAGLGEAPLLRQCTFSVWRDTESMDSYARHGSHQQAIAAAYRHGFFSESMFARLRLLACSGDWKGKSPLADTAACEVHAAGGAHG